MRSSSVLLTFVLFGCSSKYLGPDQSEVSRFDLLDDDLLLVVRVIKSKWTGFYPEKDTCPEGRICVPLCFWFTHEAKVLDIINGQFENDRVNFSILQHVNNTEQINDEWYVQLRKFENASTTENLGAEYYVENHNSEFSVCY